MTVRSTLNTNVSVSVTLYGKLLDLMMKSKIKINLRSKFQNCNIKGPNQQTLN